MAGSNAAFDANFFRDTIRSTMNMGAPVNPDEQVTFKWNTQRTFDQPADPAGVPYDLSANAVTETPHADVKVPAAVQFASDNLQDTAALGQVDTSKAVLTLLDEDYDQVKTADFVLVGGDTYDIDSVLPVGLFDVTVYQMHIHARSRA